MVIGLLIITAIPTVTGVAQAVSAQRNRDQEKKDERRMKKFHVDLKCLGETRQAKELNNGRIVLKNDRLWVGPPGVSQKGNYGYVAEAFYIEYPDPEVYLFRPEYSPSELLTARREPLLRWALSARSGTIHLY